MRWIRYQKSDTANMKDVHMRREEVEEKETRQAYGQERQARANG